MNMNTALRTTSSNVLARGFNEAVSDRLIERFSKEERRVKVNAKQKKQERREWR